MNGRDIIGEVWLLSGKKEYIHDNALFLLNRATTQVLLDLNVWNDEYSKNSVVGVQYYELPSDTLEVVGVSFDGDPLGHKNYNALKTTYESNYTPTFYAITYQSAITEPSENLIQVYIAPPPDEVAVLDFQRKMKPPKILNLDQSIPLPAFCERALTFYCKKLVYESSRLPQFANAGVDYELEIKKRNDEFGNICRYIGSMEEEIDYIENEP